MLLPLLPLAAPMVPLVAAPILVPMLACPMAILPVVLMAEGGADAVTAAAGIAAGAAAAAGIASIPGIVSSRSTWGFTPAALGAAVVVAGPGAEAAMSGIAAAGGGGGCCCNRWRRPWLPGVALVSCLGLGAVLPGVMLALALLLTAGPTWLEAPGDRGDGGPALVAVGLLVLVLVLAAPLPLLAVAAVMGMAFATGCVSRMTGLDVVLSLA